MPTVLRVFIGAPTASDLRTNQAGSLQDQWINVTSSQPLSRRRLSLEFVPLLPPATLEAASRRISEVYKYAIFQDENDEEGERDKTQAMIIDRTEHEGQTTVITWDLTPSRGANHDNSIEIERSLMSITASRIETQETQSYIYSDTSSIARFPTFNINLHSLTSLSIITKSKGKGTSKVNMLLAVLEVDGPETIRLKKGPDAGKEISILKLILGDEEGSLCKLTAWREVAEAWSGADDCIAVKRGRCDPSAK